MVRSGVTQQDGFTLSGQQSRGEDLRVFGLGIGRYWSRYPFGCGHGRRHIGQSLCPVTGWQHLGVADRHGPILFLIV